MTVDAAAARTAAATPASAALPASPASPARRGRPGYDRAQVMTIAVQLFNDQGYDATSVADLAKEGKIKLVYHLKTFLDANLRQFPSYSFHPNDNRATVVVSRSEFLRYLAAGGNTYEFIELY